MTENPKYMRTGIGSLPFKDVKEAIDVVLQYFPDVPFWPQLPKRSPLEDMFIPFLAGLPFFRLMGEGLAVEREGVGMEEFLEDLDGDRVERFAIPYELAPGLYEFLERAKAVEDSISYLKGQITGPFSCGLALKAGKEPIIYNPDIFFVVRKGIKMRARWMVERMKEACPSKPVILFFDEPYLCSLDLYFGPQAKEWIREMYEDLLEGLAALKGMHICGNTDWTLIMDLPIDILNFDAFNFFDSLFSFEEAIVSFYRKGAMISPGVVPSDAVINETDLKELKALREGFTSRLIALGVVTDIVLLTPSCGLGALDEKEAVRALELLSQLST
jgi:methionine synthase II (cobalamin-independent)